MMQQLSQRNLSSRAARFGVETLEKRTFLSAAHPAQGFHADLVYFHAASTYTAHMAGTHMATQRVNDQYVPPSQLAFGGKHHGKRVTDDSAPIENFGVMSIGGPGIEVVVVSWNFALPPMLFPGELPRHHAPPPSNRVAPPGRGAVHERDSVATENTSTVQSIATPARSGPPIAQTTTQQKTGTPPVAQVLQQAQPVAGAEKTTPDGATFAAIRIVSGALTVANEARSMALTTAATAANAASAVKHGAAEVAAAVAPVAPAKKIFQIARMGSRVGLLSDSLALLADEFAAVPAPQQTPNGYRGAWTVTAVVAVADLVWIAFLYRSTMKKRKISSCAASQPLN